VPRAQHWSNVLIICAELFLGSCWDFFRDSSGAVIADLQQSGESFIEARGGAGGKGNYFFLTNENRAPTTYEVGGRGEERVIFAELRVIADIGMVRYYYFTFLPLRTHHFNSHLQGKPG